MPRKLILNESQFIMLVEALAVEPYLTDLRDMANKCAEAANEFDAQVRSTFNWDDFDGTSYPEEIGEWQYDGDLEDDVILSYARYMGEIGDTGVNVILIYRPSEYRTQAAYNAGNDEIWVVTRGDSDAKKIYKDLTHEMTHAIDNKHGVIKNLRFNAKDMSDDQKLPECVEWLFYYLWNKSEFNAHQVGALSGAEPMDIYTYWRKKLYNLMFEANEYEDDDDIWLYVWNRYIRPEKNSHITPQHAKEYFMNKTWDLIEKFLKSIVKKTYLINTKKPAV